MKLTNLISRAALAATSVALIACTDPAEPPPDPDAAAKVGGVVELERALPPPSDEAPRYVGMWATTAEGCGEPAWRFEEEGVSTRGEVSCEFNTVALTDRGYDIQATCYAEAPPEPYNIQLSFAESARAMMVAGGPWMAGTALVYCGGLTPD